MSAADGFMTPSPGAARAELERRYRRLLRLYPREFRARRAEEMLGVLMAVLGRGPGHPHEADPRQRRPSGLASQRGDNRLVSRGGPLVRGPVRPVPGSQGRQHC
jgi:hypothetical protein